MDVTSLLRSFGDAAPSGENLEYDPVFTEMELAAAPGEERQMGDSVLAAEEPDWREVAEKATAVLEQSHDLRAAVFLATAELATRGLAGFADVTGYIRSCLQDYWETCHPQLDADDDNDPTMRVNAVLALADANTVLRGLRRAPLTDSRAFGRFNLRDIQIAEGEIVAGPEDENVPDSTLIGAAFQETGPEKLGALRAAAEQAAENVKAISVRFDEMTPGQGPELDPLVRMMNQIVARLRNATGGGGAEAAAEEEGATEDAAPAAAPRAGQPAAAAGGGAINSPNDVSNALDRIIAYYKRAEPSSPVPLLLVRAKRLVNADFMTIMKDMAPRGVENVNLIGGLDDD
ncbi:type VI secretion system protein TssA [Defluviimonas sp. WL0075]|uniref:Type VI secretion system protein TssA n=1 Tax=Albidovulum sediminicola TaxID=2984331 RepID=A0ABT2Z046_9RHOB|nr:type VI secretion system protein TssA [Defluviimonas sp. WL0075]MCV2864506.1 type VI secretion system protein TssA [Defluviimonas sp. WL0075]